MSHIYWEKHEIAIPEKAYINHSDGRVFLMTDDGNGKKKRQVIGHATSEKTMHPNEMFKFLYPSLWQEYYKETNVQEHELHAGLYAAALGAGYQTKLYPILQEVYGPLYGNAIMDYASYSILDRSDTTQLFPEKMANHVLFSKECYSDSWYSDLFKEKMTGNQNHDFRLKWLEHCAENVKKVWLSIDGSNNDCNINSSDLAEHGKAKSHINTNIVSYIWALNAEDGCPVTYFVNNGGMPDVKSFQLIAKTLETADIKIEGIILDRGFCSHEAIETLREMGVRYVIMLKNSTYAHEQMMTEYADKIRWKVRHAVDDKGIFGISSEKQLFRQHSEKAFVNLYFDGANGAARMITLIGKVRKTAAEIKEAILNGNQPVIPKELTSYFKLTKVENGLQFDYDYDNWQKDLDIKGYSSIASSTDCGAEEVNRIYNLRDSSEKQFMVLKSQLGFDVTRVHCDNSLESRFTVCFVAAILRSMYMNACKKLSFDTNQMIRELDRISFVLMPNGKYVSVNNRSKRQTELLKELGIENGDFEVFVTDVNQRLTNPIFSQIHTLPDDPNRNTKKKRGRPAKVKKEQQETKDLKEKRKPGRPKGSKNKKTLAQETEQTTQNQTSKRKPGRPKGSKNKPKVENLKRKPGRPKGSKNKPKNERSNQ